MKKSNLFFVLLTAFIVMSCSKDETTMSIPQESNAIEFGTYVGRDAQTRGTVINETNLPGLGFGVFAFYSNESTYNETTSNFTPNFMYNTKVSTTGWTYSPIKYWPNETTDKLTFFAYAPYSSTETPNNITDLSAKNTTGDPTLKFTVNGTAKSQSDLLYAEATTDNLINQSKQTIGGKVLFPFKHALSRIGFKVEVMSDRVNGDATGGSDVSNVGSEAIAAGTVVSVQKVELIGDFTKVNTFNFAKGTWTNVGITGTGIDTAAYSLLYADFDTTKKYKEDGTEDETDGIVIAERVTTKATKLNADDSYLMIIPKTFVKAVDDTNDPLQIRVTYKVTTTDGALSGGKSEITNVITSDPFGFKFDAGKAYSFNLHLGLTSVKFSATVEGWGDETGTVVNVPINTAP